MVVDPVLAFPSCGSADFIIVSKFTPIKEMDQG